MQHKITWDEITEDEINCMLAYDNNLMVYLVVANSVNDLLRKITTIVVANCIEVGVHFDEVVFEVDQNAVTGKARVSRGDQKNLSRFFSQLLMVVIEENILTTIENRGN